MMMVARALVALLVAIVPIIPIGANALEFTLEAASDDSFGRPHDIVLSNDGTRLYVADNAKHRIVVLDARTLEQRGVFGAGEVREPHDVVFDGQGRLLVADTGNSRIAIFAVDDDGGRLVSELKGPISRPEGVTVAEDGRVIASGAASGNVVIFELGKPVAEQTGFSSPHDVEIAPDGAIWLADSNNDRMVRMDDALRITRVLDDEAFGFNGPRYMDFDDDGRLYVADKYSNRIAIIAPDGSLVRFLGDKESGFGPNRFDRPEGVEIRGDDVWFSDTYNDRIVRYRITSR